MASLNVRHRTGRLREFVGSDTASALRELRRLALTGLLWEDTFYAKGSALAAQVTALVPQCFAGDVAALAVECRDKMHLRHMPLLLVRELARGYGNGRLVAETLDKVIQRPDELTEYLAIYWRDGREPLSAGSKRGLARAVRKFSTYQLAKYDRDGKVKLRDVLRLTHPKPTNGEEAVRFYQTVNRSLPAPDTWEVALSAGADKRATFERLLAEGKLGGLAFLRNLRNMEQAGVGRAQIRSRFAGDFSRVLPFRFLAAMRAAPSYAADLDGAMLRVAQDLPKLGGHTTILVDVSGSMNDPLSAKSDLNRRDAASALAVLIREVADSCTVLTFSNEVKEVPAYRGLALMEAITNSQPHMNTYLGRAINAVATGRQQDRLIVITDEQATDAVVLPSGVNGYLINVAPYATGVAYGNTGWTRVNGFSERVLDFIQNYEAIL